MSERLTPSQIARLGAVFAPDKLESVALGFLGLESETLATLKSSARENIDGYKRGVLQNWANRGMENNVRVRAVCLCVCVCVSERKVTNVDRTWQAKDLYVFRYVSDVAACLLASMSKVPLCFTDLLSNITR